MKLKEIIEESLRLEVDKEKLPEEYRDKNYEISNSAYGIGVDFIDEEDEFYTVLINFGTDELVFRKGTLYNKSQIIDIFNYEKSLASKSSKFKDLI